MTTIEYVEGDATRPQDYGPKVICHVCNDIGKWGKGFVLALSKRWSEPEAAYREWHRERESNDFALGAVQLVQAEPDIWVANMVGQHGILPKGSTVPIRYDALWTCLERLAAQAQSLGASIHMPRIGCGLAGGTWDRVEPIINDTLCAHDISVTVYDLPGSRK